MAPHERLDSKTSIASQTLIQQFSTVLPKDINFKIYHISTPPTWASALYSAPPGVRQDRTYCERHFLSVSIQTPTNGSSSESKEVLVFAVEVLIYSTAYDSTFFVSKADSTGYLNLLHLPKGASSPIRDISGTFLDHLIEQRQRQNIRSVVSLFARAQDQYLFPGSIEYSGKHALDDRGLVRWWCRVLDPLIRDSQKQTPSQWDSVKGYLTVPGLDRHETLSYIPRTSISQWTIGHPLREISRHPIDVPPRCFIPHFPDDPKARYLDELDDEISKVRDGGSGQWKSVKSIDQFWEMMAFRQECSAGRLVGFIWIVFTPSTPDISNDSVMTDSQSTAMTAESELWDTNSSFSQIASSNLLSPSTSCYPSSQPHPTKSPVKLDNAEAPSASQKSRSPHTPKKYKLTGPIIPRQPRIKTENKNYLLERPETTPYYIWRMEGRGQVIVEESDYKRVTELLLRLDFANLELASSSSVRWINEVRSGAVGDMRDAWGQIVTGTKAIEAQNVASTAGVNTLNVGLVRKKRKAGDEEVKEPPSAVPAPTVNTLPTSMIRKKAKV
jgi:regulator of Ty1 transposition protein 109